MPDLASASGRAPATSSALDERIDALARTPVLLVACDFDGTIAPIVPTPDQAFPDREAIVALGSLAKMPHTHVTVISGRALADLAHRTRDAEDLHLIGSHGSEFEPGFASALSPEATSLRARLLEALSEIAGRYAGTLLEEKPAAAAFHYRGVQDGAARAALEEVFSGPAAWPGVHLRQGKCVVELSVVETNKGTALTRIRHRVAATAALFLGDDLTDEDAFVTLAGPDVGVKVGDGETRAAYRIADTHAAARLLARLAELRFAWLAGSHAVPIEHHAMLSDQRTFALLDSGGRVVWWCVPRLDATTVFAELLGGPAAGFFEITPIDGEAASARAPRYLSDTFVLETAWPGLRLTDYLDAGDGRAYQRAGRSDLLRVIEGRGRVRIRFAPRMDFGRIATRLTVVEDGLVIEGGSDPIILRAPGIAWSLIDDGPHQTAEAELAVNDDPIVLELRYGTGNLSATNMPESDRRRQTELFWSRWAQSLAVPNLHADAVRRSALVLKALTFGPTGSIAAAATTSLPEEAGGVRNWDYRYCWPRDAAMASASLVRLGSTGGAMKFLDWMLGILDHCEAPDRLRPVYTVTGGHLGAEAELTALPGYRGSRPIRIGNAAAGQVQLDVFGPIAELVALLAERGTPLSSEHWRLVEMMVEAVENRWHEPDHGIWEVRMAKRHHVHSKVMCWQTVDRALKVADYLGRKRPQWPALRERIRDDVLEHGFNADVGAFTTAYESPEPDAAALWVGLSGMLPPNDSRFLGTIDCIERKLLHGPTVYRYRMDDGLPGAEGGFHICTTWLIEAMAMTGRIDQASGLLNKLVGLIGPTGLLSEQYDPDAAMALGNYPQAYSHLGLIDAVMRLKAAGE